jgi:hypothetical protein
MGHLRASIALSSSTPGGCGVVTDADLLRKLDPAGQTGLMGALMGRGSFRGEMKITARDVMRTPPTTVPADTPVADAAQRMLEARRKVLPITDADGHLIGVLDRADLLRSPRALSADRCVGVVRTRCVWGAGLSSPTAGVPGAAPAARLLTCWRARVWRQRSRWARRQ